MTLQLVLELERIASPAVELDGIVTGNSESLLIGREGVVGDWVVEEVVNFGVRHGGG